MARFAPVVPLHIAQALEREGQLGQYHLLLAHDVVARQDEYSALYSHRDWYIIMDNSVVELGGAVDPESIVQAAQCVGASYMIAPDVMGDTIKTLDAVDSFLAHPAVRKCSIPVMAVVQGRSDRDVDYCLHTYRVGVFPMVQGIAVPRLLVKHLGTRSRVTLEATRTWTDVHLLGFSDNMIDDVACARIPGVQGIDSAVPIRLGLQLRDLRLADYEDPGPRENYWTAVPQAKAQLSGAIHNIGLIRKWIDVGNSRG